MYCVLTGYAKRWRCGVSQLVIGRGTGKNGRQVIFEGIDVFEINQDGKIQTMWGCWDPAAMMAQLQR